MARIDCKLLCAPIKLITLRRFVIFALAVGSSLTYDYINSGMLCAQALLYDKRDNVTWRDKFIDISIKLLIGVFGVWEGALIQTCVPGITDAMGITNNSSVVDDMSNCGIAIGVTMAVAWIALTLNSPGDFILNSPENFSRLHKTSPTWETGFIQILLINILIMHLVPYLITTKRCPLIIL